MTIEYNDDSIINCFNLTNNIETAYANHLKVEQYITNVFKTLPLINVKSIAEVSELLPYSDKLPQELKIKS